MESVRKRDGRSLDHKALEDIRIQAVQRVEARGAPSAVMRVMGFAHTVIYEADGAAARLGVSHGDAEQPANRETSIAATAPTRPRQTSATMR